MNIYLYVVGNDFHSGEERVQMYVCMCVCVFIKLHITAQSGPVILVIL